MKCIVHFIFLFLSNIMKKFALIFTILSIASAIALGQKPDSKTMIKPTADVGAVNSAAVNLAKAVFTAHGGDKFKAMKTMVIKGSVDVTSPAIPQAIPGGFSMAFAGDKYRIEISTPVQSLKQSFDGEQTYTSSPVGALPPLNRLGFPLLQRLGDDGFVVSPLPGESKKKLGFRITAPDGFFTDFFVDEKTKQIKSYESMYELSGRTFTTSVDVGKYRLVDGVSVPEKYSQRFDFGQIVVYGDFKAKDILLNTELSSEVFSSIK
jgi:hypothetical protein